MPVTLPVVSGSNNIWGATLNNVLTQLDQTDTTEATTRATNDTTETNARTTADTALAVKADSGLYRGFLYNGAL